MILCLLESMYIWKNVLASVNVFIDFSLFIRKSFVKVEIPKLICSIFFDFLVVGDQRGLL